MPTFDFDVTEKAVEYALDSIDGMAGNAGQQSLIDSLDIDAYSLISVHIAGFNVDVEPIYDIEFRSSHPEAIEQIIDHATEAFQEYSERAADILALVDEAYKQL